MKKIIISMLVCLLISTALNAKELDLKANMNILSGSLFDLQRGFLSNDKKYTLKALEKFEKNIQSTLGDKQKIKSLLPVKLRYKSNIAVNSGIMIVKHIKKIKEVLNDEIKGVHYRQKISQKAFVNIQTQCFRCHNLLRDLD